MSKVLIMDQVVNILTFVMQLLL